MAKIKQKIKKRRLGKLNIGLVVLALGVLIGAMFFIYSWVQRNPQVLGVEEIVDMQVPQWYTQTLVVSRGNKSLGVTPLAGEKVEVERKNNQFIYHDAYPYTDVVQTEYHYKIKEELIFKQPGHPIKFQYRLGNVEKYYVERDDRGNIVFYDRKLYEKHGGANNLSRVFTIPTPFIEDSQKNRSFIDIKVVIEGDLLTVTINKDWLDNLVYPVIVDPTIEINVINVHSHPQQGDNWEVSFTTQGQADLKIIPNDQATIDDDEFVSLWCNDEQRTPQILENDVIFYENWYCNEVGKVIHYTLRAGKHTLKFDFGGQIAFAYNAAKVANLIVAWPYASSTLAGKGWYRDPVLDSYFLKSIPNGGVEPGTNINNTDTHTHDTSNDGHAQTGWHSHTGNGNTEQGSGSAGSGADSAAVAELHVHTIPDSDAIVANAIAAGQTTLGTASNEPAYQEVLWIYSSGSTDIPNGAIAFFDSADDIPAGWTATSAGLFYKGAADGTDPSQIAQGSDEHNHDDDHTHTQDAAAHAGDTTGGAPANSGAVKAGGGIAAAGHTHPVTWGGNSWTTGSASANVASTTALPPFIGLVAAQNNTGSAATPDKVIAMWRQTLATIDSDWDIYANIFNLFVRATTTAGLLDTGGATSHSHTVSGSHYHTSNHTHTLGFGILSAEVKKDGVGTTVSDDAHTHADKQSTSGGADTDAVTITVDTSATETRPPFYEVAFIQYSGAPANANPTVTAASANPSSVQPGNVTITFSVDWDDADVGESIKIKICQTNSLTGQNCTDDWWASSTTFTDADPATVATTTTITTNGYYDFWAFVCDDGGLCSNSYYSFFRVGYTTYLNSSITGYYTSGLVGYWTFNGEDIDWWTNTAYDRSGQGNDGTIYNMSTTSSPVIGKVGQGLVFDGVDDYVGFGSVPSLQISGNLTLSLWINASTAGDGKTIIDQSRFGDDIELYNTLYELIWNTASGNDLEYSHEYDAGLDQANVFDTNLSTGQWYHITLVRDITAKTVKLYLNANQADTTYNYTSNPTGGSDGTFVIGNRDLTSEYYDGLLDEVRVYNRTLSEGEILDLYRAGTRIFQVNTPVEMSPGLVGAWTFNGSDMDWGSTTAEALDTSGNSNNGDVTNGAKAAIGKVGQGLEFDGMDDRVDMGDPGSLNFGENSFSYGLWVKPIANVGAYDTVLYKGGASTGNAGYDIELGSGVWEFNISDGSTKPAVNFTPDDPVGKWVHLFAVVDRSANFLYGYANGTEKGSTNITGFGSVSNAATSFTLGSQDDGDYPVRGDIDEVRIYNRALSPSEILDHYRAGARKVEIRQ